MLIEMLMFRAAMVRANEIRTQTMAGPRDFVVLPAAASQPNADGARK